MSSAPDSQADDDSLVGSVLAGRYRILAELGAGGMGIVYRAEHVHMRKAVAVKVLHREMSSMPEVVARFEREAVAAARIEHPNVATATDFGSLENGSFYLVLEFVEGRSLAALLRAEGPLPEPRALNIARQIADALNAAHAAGIIHRDLKPDNVMLVERDGKFDFVKVLDFGIAKVKLEASAEQPLTQMGVVFGTPEYMSPEQARGLDVDARSDVYALGLILYEMLSGNSPFRHDDLVAVLTRQITMNPEPLPESVSAATCELTFKLLRKDPAERLQSAASVRDHLDSLLRRGEVSSALGTPPSSETPGATVVFAGAAHARTNLALPMLARTPLRALRAKLARFGLERLALERRVAIGKYAVPLGAVLVLGTLLAIACVLGVVLIVFGGSTKSREVAALPTRPADPDLLALSLKAETGDLSALAALAARPPKSRSLVEWRALGHGYCRIENDAACLEVYSDGINAHREIGNDPNVLADIRRLAERPARADAAQALAAGSLGSTGADLLYDVWEKNRNNPSPAAQHARALLDDEPAKSHLSAALRAALLLQAAFKKPKCPDIKLLLPDIARDVDERSLSLLNRLSERRGCGFLGLSDCYGCLRGNSELGRALEAAKGRGRPSFVSTLDTPVSATPEPSVR